MHLSILGPQGVPGDPTRDLLGKPREVPQGAPLGPWGYSGKYPGMYPGGYFGGYLGGYPGRGYPKGAWWIPRGLTPRGPKGGRHWEGITYAVYLCPSFLEPDLMAVSSAASKTGIEPILLTVLGNHPPWANPAKQLSALTTPYNPLIATYSPLTATYNLRIFA